MLSRSTEMMNRLQPFMRQSVVYKTIFEAVNQVFTLYDEVIQDVHRQLCIETATGGLSLYEKELGILGQPNKPLDERRAVIKSKIRGTGKVDAVRIKMVADSYTRGDVDVTYSNSAIGITFTSIKGIPPNIYDLQQIIEEIKPAHLAYTFTYTYTWWTAVKPLTWGQVRGKTWDALRVYEGDKNETNT